MSSTAGTRTMQTVEQPQEAELSFRAPESRIAIVRFDPATATRDDWAAYHVYRRVRQEEASPDDPMSTDAEVEADMQQPDPHGEAVRWLARSPDGAVAGSGSAYLLRREAPGY